MQYLGRLSDGRTPVLSQTDLYVQQSVRLGGASRLAFGISVSNLFNRGTVISRFAGETEQAAGLAISEADLYAGRLDFQRLLAEQNVLRDPRFLMANGYQAPRTARLMVKWSF